MRLLGTAEFIATPEEVWAFLIDPSNLGPCSPVPVERVDGGRYRAVARLGGGLFSATLALDLEVVDVVAGRQARIVGRGGAGGTTVEGSSSFQIRAGTMDGTTCVDWEVEIRLSGVFAGQATRIVEDRAPAAVERLLTCIHERVEG